MLLFTVQSDDGNSSYLRSSPPVIWVPWISILDHQPIDCVVCIFWICWNCWNQYCYHNKFTVNMENNKYIIYLWNNTSLFWAQRCPKSMWAHMHDFLPVTCPSPPLVKRINCSIIWCWVRLAYCAPSSGGPQEDSEMSCAPPNQYKTTLCTTKAYIGTKLQCQPLCLPHEKLHILARTLGPKMKNVGGDPYSKPVVY